MSEMTTTIEPVRKRATVPCPPGEAFRLFTAEIGAWWPLVSHSVGRGDATAVEMGPGVGGEIVETVAGGATHVWGTVTAWEPGRRVAFTWHPGHPSGEATAVEVTFEPGAAGEGCDVTLVHTGWERRPDGAAARSDYDGGWDIVFGRYHAHAG